MPGFVIHYTTKTNGLVQIDGQTVKYWQGTGLPDFEGDLETFAETYPGIAGEMVRKKFLVPKLRPRR